MRKAIVLPGIALCGGLVGLVLRQCYLSRAFEPGTGLFRSGEPITYVMWAVALVTVAALLVLSRGTHRTFQSAYTSAFSPNGFVTRAGCLAGAALLLLAGVLNIELYVSNPGINSTTGLHNVSLLRPVLGVFCLVGAVSIWFVQQAMAGGKPVKGLWPQFPALACFFWVLANYQTWSQDPVMARYLFSLIATLLSMLACMLMAEFAYGKGRVMLTLLTSLSGAAFCIMVLGDGLPLVDLALSIAMAFYLLSMSACLLTNDAKPEPPEKITPPSCGGMCQTCPGCPPVQPVQPREKTQDTDAPRQK